MFIVRIIQFVTFPNNRPSYLTQTTHWKPGSNHDTKALNKEIYGGTIHKCQMIDYCLTDESL